MPELAKVSQLAFRLHSAQRWYNKKKLKDLPNKSLGCFFCFGVLWYVSLTYQFLDILFVV